MNFSENKVFAFGSREEKCAIFDTTVKNLSARSENDRFLSLLDLRVYFFSDATERQREEYIDGIISCMSESNTFLASYTELLGVLFKFCNQPLREKMSDAVISLCDKIAQSVRGVVSLLNFYKISHRMFDCETDGKLTAFIEKMSKTAPSQLGDTFAYTLNNRSREFVQKHGASVLFIVPELLSGMSFLQTPISLMTAMAQAEGAGLKCDLLDNRIFNYGLEQVAELSKNYKYAVVCSSPIDQVQNYFLDYRYDIFRLTVKAVKESGATVIVCGAHGTVKPKLVMEETPADYLICGEFDFQIAELLKLLHENKPVAVAPNVWFRNDNTLQFTFADKNKLHPEEWCNTVVPYEKVLHTDYFGYDFFENTHVKKMNWGILQTSRGCPYKCAFCYDFYEKRVRFKELDGVIKEISKLIESGVSEVFFIDQTFTLNREYTVSLCNRIISEGLKFSWRCETRVDLLDGELLSLMKKAGCHQIWMGVESLDETVLQKNDKNYGISTLENTVALIDKAGISYCVFIMLGMVGDTAQSVRETVDKIVGRNLHITRSIITFTPRFGTAIVENGNIFGDKADADFHTLYYLKGSVANEIDSCDLADGLSRLLQYVSK